MSKKFVNGREITITGYWDGQPMWRYKTMGEILMEEIEKNRKSKLAESKEKQHGHS